MSRLCLSKQTLQRGSSTRRLPAQSLWLPSGPYQQAVQCNVQLHYSRTHHHLASLAWVPAKDIRLKTSNQHSARPGKQFQVAEGTVLALSKTEDLYNRPGLLPWMAVGQAAVQQLLTGCPAIRTPQARTLTYLSFKKDPTTVLVWSRPVTQRTAQQQPKLSPTKRNAPMQTRQC